MHIHDFKNTQRIVELLKEHGISINHHNYRYIYIFKGVKISNDISIDTYDIKHYSDDEILEYVKKHIINKIVNRKEDTNKKTKRSSITNIRWEHLTKSVTPDWAEWMKQGRNSDGKIIFKFYLSSTTKKLKLLNCESNTTYVTIKDMADGYELANTLNQTFSIH